MPKDLEVIKEQFTKMVDKFASVKEEVNSLNTEKRIMESKYDDLCKRKEEVILKMKELGETPETMTQAIIDEHEKIIGVFSTMLAEKKVVEEALENCKAILGGI